MNHDFTLTTLASRPVVTALPPDIRELNDHIGGREPRMLRLRRATSAWLYRLAVQVDPRPARTERDDLFDSIAALLTESKCEGSKLETASQRSC